VNLPDYSRCVEFFRLHVEMGIRAIPSVPPIVPSETETLKTLRELPDPEEAALGMRLTREAVPVKKGQIARDANGALMYRGRLVCAYVRDQRDSVVFDGLWRRYVYHLLCCQTLQRVGDRLELLATQRTDGQFEVHDLSGNHPRKALTALELCPDCRAIWNEMDADHRPFDLRAYFEGQATHQVRKLREVAAEQIEIPRSDGHDLADFYREACAFMCQACGVDCSDVPELLHLHYEDGDPTHTDPRNLHILCVDCHADRPGHDHMEMQPVVQDGIDQVQMHRKGQGIVSLKAISRSVDQGSRRRRR